MKYKLKALAILFSIPFVALVAFKTQSVTAQTKVETAGQKFKNIKVLNDMPADQLGKVMNIAAASLGVKCDFCHVPDQWAKDEKKPKATAREMMKMMFEINKNHFKGRPEVTCNSCHNGREQPQNVANLMPVASDERPKQPDTKPTADQIIDKYLTALGGTAKLATVTSLQISATRVEPDGKTEPETISFKTNKYAAATTYGKFVVAEGYDGTAAWKRSDHTINLKADESEQIKREAELFSPANLKAIYTKMDFRFVDRIDAREVNVVTATTAGGVRECLAFDVQTGLLVRRSAATQTVFGNFIYQVDYADYKAVGGVKMPMTFKYSMPGIRWTRKIVKVKVNAPVDDSKFKAPDGSN